MDERFWSNEEEKAMAESVLGHEALELLISLGSSKKSGSTETSTAPNVQQELCQVVEGLEWTYAIFWHVSRSKSGDLNLLWGDGHCREAKGAEKGEEDERSAEKKKKKRVLQKLHGLLGGGGELEFGDDEFGHMLVNILKSNGVNADGACYDKDARTALAFVTLKKNGEREFMFYRNPSADMLLKESELNMDLIKKAKIFHYGSISLITEPCRSAHIAAMKAAKSAVALLSYDPNLRLPLWPSAEAARQGIKSIWKEADFIKVSDDEVQFLTQGDPTKEDVILSLWFEGLKLLVVTEGEKGCRYFTKSSNGRVDGFSANTVDTTGAGDAFVGALLTAVAKDTNIFNDEGKLKGALRFANACGAICTTQKGAIPALPTPSAVNELIAKYTK